MPVVSEFSKPKRYMVTLVTGRFFQGPALDGQIDSALPGHIQVLDYGIAMWQTQFSRVLYPWTRVDHVDEQF